MCVCVCVWCLISKIKRNYFCVKIYEVHTIVRIYIYRTQESTYTSYDIFIYFTKYMRYDISCLLACPATGRFIL